jgi:group I intron endonuclease
MKPLKELIEEIPKNTIGIYKITSPSGKVYIGQSRCVMSRFIAYERRYKSIEAQVRLYASFKKYGVDGHTFEIIEECGFEELNSKERYWQDSYDVIGKIGLNCLLTKTSELPTKVSEETRLKMKISQTGKRRSKESIEKTRLRAIGSKRTEETKLKMRLAQLGKKNSDAHRKATSDGLREYYKNNVSKKLGVKNSPEHIAKCRAFMLSDLNPNRGSKRSEETKKKMSVSIKASENIPRNMIYNINTKIIYKSIKDASESEGIAYSTLKHQFCGRKIYREELVRLSIVC